MKKLGWLYFTLWVAILLLQLAHHQLWADELQSWMIIRASPNLSTLIANLRYEGHPSLWYVLLWLAQHIYDNVSVLKILHAAVGIANLLIIAKLSPFTRLQKTFLICGYLFSFEYFIISRSYAIGVTFLLLYFWLTERYPQKTSWRSILLGLAVNTSLFAAFAALFFFFDMQWERYKKDKTNIKGLFFNQSVLLFGLLSLIAFSTAYPARDADPHFSVTLSENDRAPSFMHTGFEIFDNSFAPIPETLPNFWNSNAIRRMPFLLLILMNLVLLSPLAYLLYHHRKKAYLLGARSYF